MQVLSCTGDPAEPFLDLKQSGYEYFMSTWLQPWADVVPMLPKKATLDSSAKAMYPKYVLRIFMAPDLVVVRIRVTISGAGASPCSTAIFLLLVANKLIAHRAVLECYHISYAPSHCCRAALYRRR